MNTFHAARPGHGQSGKPAASNRSQDAAAMQLAEAVSDFMNTDAADSSNSTNDVPGAASFLRAYSALARSVPKPRRRALYRVMGEALAAAARREELDDSADADNAAFLAELRAGETRERQRDLAEGRLLPSAAMRERLGISRQALSAALRAQRLFALSGPSGDYLYPAFFADPGLDRAVLERVCRTLGALPGGAKWEFFTTPRQSLGRKTPLQALARGKVDAVLAAAAAFAES
jgi:hypothetical protein